MKKLLISFFTLFSLTQLQCNNINWSVPPTTLSSVSVNASDPHVAIDANGNVIAIWMENGLVKASTHHVNMGWNTAVTLSATGASSPRIVSDSNGNATAVWLVGGIVYGASKAFSGNWSSSTALSSSGASAPDLAVDSAGDVIAVWVSGSNVQSSTKLFGASWQSRVSITSTAAACPRVAIGGSGSSQRAVVVWQGTSGTTNVTYASTKLISGSWSTGVVISNTTHNASCPAVAVDPNQNTTAVWYRYDVTGTNYSNVVVQSSTMPSSGSWSTPVSLSLPGIRNPANLTARVAYDSTGNALALWNTSFDGETFNVESAVRPVRGTWTSPTDLVSANLFANEADLAVTSFGDVLATYMYYNGASLLIQSVEADISASISNPWSVPINFSTGTDNGYPRIAASLTGNVINAATVWMTYNGTHTLIAATTGKRTVVLPPSSLAASQSLNNFGVFNDYYNTLSWNASTDPTVTGYLIFRNGVFIEQVTLPYCKSQTIIRCKVVL